MTTDFRVRLVTLTIFETGKFNLREDGYGLANEKASEDLLD